MKPDIETLARAVEARDGAGVIPALEKALNQGALPAEIVAALGRGLEKARLSLVGEKASLPEFLLTLDVMNLGLRHLTSLQGPDAGGRSGAAVIGVVEGDVHDLGKNVVAGVLAASGLSVSDLGRDVSMEAFLASVEKSQARILALSAMMSTPLKSMEKIVAACKNRFPKVSVIVGGAALDPTLAGNLGADGYAENAVGVPEVLKGLSAGRVFVDYENKVRVVESPVRK